VHGSVQRPVTAAVEPVPHSLSAAGRHRAGPGQCGEGGVAADAPDVGEGHDDLCRADRPDTGTVGESGCELVDQVLQLTPVVLEHFRGVTYGARESADLAVPHRLSPVGIDR
jgi:uncharacterized low-complexity protein